MANTIKDIFKKATTGLGLLPESVRQTIATQQSILTRQAVEQKAKKIVPTPITVDKTTGTFSVPKPTSKLSQAVELYKATSPFFALTSKTGEPSKKLIEEKIVTPALNKTINTPVGKKVTKYVSEKTANIPVKLITYSEALATGKNPEENYQNFLKAFQNPYVYDNKGNLIDTRTQKRKLAEEAVMALQGTLPQTGVGVALNTIPVIGPALSTAYWTALSSQGEIERKGKLIAGENATPEEIQKAGKIEGFSGLGNVMIDVALDRVLGDTLGGLAAEGTKNTVAKLLLSSNSEGATEVLQTLLRFANTYANEPENRVQTLEELKNYLTSGQIFLEYGTGAISGLGIGAAYHGVGPEFGQQNKPLGQNIIPEVGAGLSIKEVGGHPDINKVGKEIVPPENLPYRLQTILDNIQEKNGSKELFLSQWKTLNSNTDIESKNLLKSVKSDLKTIGLTPEKFYDTYVNKNLVKYSEQPGARVRVQPAIIPRETKLSKDLAGAKPRYGYGSKLFTLDFNNDIDKAFYIIAKEIPSKADARYVEFLRGIYPELTVGELREKGKIVRSTIKGLASNSKSENLVIKGIFLPENNINKITKKEIIPKPIKTIPLTPPQNKDILNNVDSNSAQRYIQMYSPNIEENLAYNEAKKRLSGERQANIKSIIKDFTAKNGVTINEISNVIGDTKSYGTENAIIEDGNAKTIEQTKYLAAQKGLVGNQKTVLNFILDQNGKDNLYTIKHSLDNESVIKILNDNGLEYRTLDKGRFLIYDEGGENYQLVNNVNKKINGQLTTNKGTGEFIGGETRAQGLQEYKRIISEYESGPLYTNSGLPNAPQEEVVNTKEKIIPQPRKITQVSKGIEEAAVDKKLTQGIDNLTTYQKESFVEQLKQVDILIANDYNTAKQIALGNIPSPNNIEPGLIFKAVEARELLLGGDISVLDALATKSKLPEDVSRTGQFMAAFADQSPESPVNTIRELAKLRSITGKSVSREEKENIIKMARDVAITKDAWLLEKPQRLADKLNNKIVSRKPTEIQLKYGRAYIAFHKYVISLKIKGLKETPKQFLSHPGSIIKTIAGTAKSIRSSLDNSFSLRQGMKLLLTHPGIWRKNFDKSWEIIAKTFRGKDVMDEVMADIVSRDNYADMLRDGVTFGVEEAFPDNIIERVPIIGLPFKASDNAYTAQAYLDRADIYDLYTDIARKEGIQKTTGLGIGNLANALTSRANLGKFEPAAEILNEAFWSPRSIKANFDTLTSHLFDKGASRFVKKQAAINLAKIIGGETLILLLTKLRWPDYVELDPRSSNFGQIVVGKRHFDISGGMRGLITLAARIATKSTKSPTTGKITQLNSGEFGGRTILDIAYDFMEGKLSPFVSVLFDIARGENFLGEPVTAKGELENLFMPMPVSNFLGSGEDPAMGWRLISSMADALGVGTSYFGDDRSEYKKAKDKLTEELEPNKLRVEVIYNHVQEILSSNPEEAQYIVDNLSDADYEIYKNIRTAEKTKRTNALKEAVFPIYQKAQSLKESGNIQEAQKLVDSLTDEEYRVYKLIMDQFK